MSSSQPPMCPEAAKFRIAPLQDEEDMRIIFDKNAVTNVTARVPPSSEDRASQSRINIDEVEGSGCEGEDETLVTPSRARGTKNKRCPYSPSPAATPRLRTGSGSVSRLDRVIDLIEKKEKAKEEEKSRNSVTSPGPGWPGSVHDTRVWTDARPRFHNYPHPPHGKYYLVDSGYPNRTGYLAPFKEQRYHVPDFQGAPPQNMEEKFNHLHSSLRNAIERAFGVLKLKWRILLSIPHYHDPLTQTKIITACMCLHNFIRDSKLYDDHFDRMERSSYIYEDSASFPGGHASSSSDGVMGALRQIIAESLVA